MSADGTYLDGIVADVRARLARSARADRPVAAALDQLPGVVSLRASIAAAAARGELAVIAEVKRRSPSVGDIAPDADPAGQAAAYARAGAAGISVLTEPDHFGGCLTDLGLARAGAGPATPLLRKDFVVEERQLDEARTAGADAVLLIAALHDEAALVALVGHARGIGLEVLLEVHDEADLERALATSAELIGINNRDLRSFVVDLAITEQLAPLVPADRLVVAESGVRSPADAARMRSAGADAVLVGESLMRADDPGVLLRALAGGAVPDPAGAAT